MTINTQHVLFVIKELQNFIEIMNGYFIKSPKILTMILNPHLYLTITRQRQKEMVKNHPFLSVPLILNFYLHYICKI